MEEKKTISILVPCYNEVNNIEAMAIAITEQMEQLKQYDYEIIFRDNASTDGSLEVLRKIAKQDKRIKVIVNSRNYGVDGTKNSFVGRIHGDVIISIACDFQEPPELIPEFIYWWEQGYEVVCGQKTGSEEGFIKYGCRKLYYNIISSLSDVPQYKHISGITLKSRRIQEMHWTSGKDVSFRQFLADIGCDIKLIAYEQRKRRSGKSSYNVWRYLSFAIKSMVATSTVPLRIATVSGVISSILSFVVGLIYLIQKIVLWDRFPLGTAPILIGMFFIGSIQLLFIGMIGEYVGAILKKISSTSSVPPIVRELINYEGDDDYLVESAMKHGSLNNDTDGDFGEV